MANPQNLRPFPKGVSGNPKGRPPRGRAFEDLTKLIDETPGALRAISRLWLKEILKGNFQFFREYLDRSDGKALPADEAKDDASSEDFGLLVKVPTVKQAQRKAKAKTKKAAKKKSPRAAKGAADAGAGPG